MGEIHPAGDDKEKENTHGQFSFKGSNEIK